MVSAPALDPAINIFEVSIAYFSLFFIKKEVASHKSFTAYWNALIFQKERHHN